MHKLHNAHHYLAETSHERVAWWPQVSALWLVLRYSNNATCRKF